MASSHQKRNSLLLIQRLLSLREGASPFTLILDSLEQSANPLLKEYIQRTNSIKTPVIFISFETLEPPLGTAHIVHARRKDFGSVQAEVLRLTKSASRTLLIIDSLHPLLALSSPLPSLLFPLLTPNTSLLAVYHTSIPPPSSAPLSAYAPAPLSLLSYLATTIMTVHSLPQTIARQQAAAKSLAEPVFGLQEEKEGVLIGTGANGQDAFVVEVEHRRKSGRTVGLSFVLQRSSAAIKASAGAEVVLLDDHPSIRAASQASGAARLQGSGVAAEEEEVTFNLSLTERQRRAREGVVLPYFDAQKGGGEGGRILYEMGREDDFDDEEDEI